MRTQKGFSLIELMITVAIVGVLAAIAYPAYTNAVMKSHRTDAKVALNDLAQRLQRCFTLNSSFMDTSGEEIAKTCSVQLLLASDDGVKSENGYYKITGANFTATTYTLTTEPVTGKGQDKDNDCKTFILTEKGAKTAKDDSGGNSTDKCW
jgi:type IV pilus assembly protein PilE